MNLMLHRANCKSQPIIYILESTTGSEGDPEVILLVTFVDWVKKIVTDERTDPRMDRCVGRNNDLDYSQTIGVKFRRKWPPVLTMSPCS